MTAAQVRAHLASHTRPPEPDTVRALLDLARVSPEQRAHIVSRGHTLIDAARRSESVGWVEEFLQRYGLDTQEGVALLSLAEAFLRIPDHKTADALIREKLGTGNWETSTPASLLVQGASWGLVFTRFLLGETAQSSAIKRLIARSGEPFVRQAVASAMHIMAEQFVFGSHITQALATAGKKDFASYRFSFDMLGESAHTKDDAARYWAAYREAIRAVGATPHATPAVNARHSVSIKLSALHPRYEYAHHRQCVPALIEACLLLCGEAAAQGIGLTIDAEESERLDLSLDIIEALIRAPHLADWNGLGFAVQAYQKRARCVLEWVTALGAETGRRVGVRLVKGAYWDREIKAAQEQGLSGYPVFTRKAATDVSYLACARIMLASPFIAPAFATHNALTVATIMEWCVGRDDVEFQRLHGMGRGVYESVLPAHPVRIYAPVGGYRDLLAYLVRRLLENGANSSFVHQLSDPQVSHDDLLRDPVADCEAAQCQPHPAIPLPEALYAPSRQNSRGLDLADGACVDQLMATMARIGQDTRTAAPLIEGVWRTTGAPQPLYAPAHPQRCVGHVIEASPQDCTDAVAAAVRAQPAWAHCAVDARADCLERLADLLEQDRDALIMLCVYEAGKTVRDAVSEVREAVDFCRYYAVQARSLCTEMALPGPTGERNSVRLEPRGVFVCISPWNFPLAIFIGQIAAALVTGNAVVAKPAPQTPLVAARAARHILASGVPMGVFHYLPGGADIGAACVAHPDVRGVAFTGSNPTARSIARGLLEDPTRPLVPLIAETGGVNVMIVDSTALPEQVVTDVLASAFHCAGQRCSALRILAVQEEIFPTILTMLKGAMDTLCIGDPADVQTDVGPVIDQAAYRTLHDYVQAHKDQILHQCRPIEAMGLFVPPTCLKIDRIDAVEREVFGPVLHVVSWPGGALDDLIDQINALGYGLTMGLHTRLHSVIAHVKARARVGTLYVNRSMVGAVVGVQPFGGEGLSGTGPKAGGPYTVLRFCTERTLSIDTTSQGGNTALFMSE